MMYESQEKKTTALLPSVGADGGQPSRKSTDQSIPDDNPEINPDSDSLEDMLRKMRRMTDPHYLHTISMTELYQTTYKSRPPIIDGLLYAGAYILAGAPKIGKSFLVAQIAYHVSTGERLWEYEVHQGTVLYLALEDDYSGSCFARRVISARKAASVILPARSCCAAVVISSLVLSFFGSVVKWPQLPA